MRARLLLAALWHWAIVLAVVVLLSLGGCDAAGACKVIGVCFGCVVGTVVLLALVIEIARKRGWDDLTLEELEQIKQTGRLPDGVTAEALDAKN